MKRSLKQTLRAAVIAVAGFVMVSGAARAASEPARVTVIHGISGLPAAVDVYVNGTLAFSFDYLDVVGPLELPAGDHELEVKLGTNTVLAATAAVAAGGNYTVVAHFRHTGGAPDIALSVFENTLTALCAKQSRLIVRHLADAPAVDLVVSRGATTTRNFVSAPNLSSAVGGQAQAGPLDFKAGTYRAALYVAGTNTQAFDSGKLRLADGTLYIAYALGSLSGETFTVYVQTVEDVAKLNCRP